MKPSNTNIMTPQTHLKAVLWHKLRSMQALLHSYILTIIKSAAVTLLPWKVSHEPNVNFVESTAVENSLLIKMFCMEGVLSFCYSLQNWIVGTLKWETCENMISGDKWALEIYWRWKERDKVYQQTPRSGKSTVFIKRKWRHNLGKEFLKKFWRKKTAFLTYLEWLVAQIDSPWNSFPPLVAVLLSALVSAIVGTRGRHGLLASRLLDTLLFRNSEIHFLWNVTSVIIQLKAKYRS